MVIMALDHTREFLTNVPFDPGDLQRTWTVLFLTRWVSDFCAPLFFLLAGVGAYFYGKRHNRAALTKFLLTRGSWLVFVEFTIIGTAWTFVFPSGFFGVIWTLGVSMIILAGVARLRVHLIAYLGIAVICLHNLFDFVRPASFGGRAWVWNVLHVKGSVQILGVREFVAYPLLPWCAVMGLGYALGWLLHQKDRRTWMIRIGVAMTIGFIVLRVTNIYGNPPTVGGGAAPGEWHAQADMAKTFILFLDTEKYPPSLQFLLMTLGPSLLLLGWLNGRNISGWWRPLLVFGRVPMFFYVVHLYFIHAVAVVVAILWKQPYVWLLRGGFGFNDLPDGYGHNLPFVYAMWGLIMVVLYFVCRWFSELKQRRREWWLSYL
jgi:uncharacterized membrane protein